MIAMGCVGFFLANVSGEREYEVKKGNLQFFMFPVVVGCLIVITLFLLFVIGFHERRSGVNWPLVVSISHHMTTKLEFGHHIRLSH